ncbi:S41 family peptidase [Candidatus Saccharibacteria bacterium]|nr:S41 family peptidase [Candidatus Saccharibacteria bacterium]
MSKQSHINNIASQTTDAGLDRAKRRPFISLGNFIAITAVVFIVGFVAGTRSNAIFSTISDITGVHIRTTEQLDFSSVNDLYNELRHNFNGELDEQTLIDGAKRGLVAAAGDRYTVFMDQQEAEEFVRGLRGDVGAGIGVEIGTRNGLATVVRTLRDNPAVRAGVRAGDVFYSINDETVIELPADEVASLVRGPAGTSVRITFLRGDEQIEFNIVREQINNPSVEVDFEGDVAVLRISRFDPDTSNLARRAAQDIRDRNINRVVLDLRNNTGGYVSAAQGVLGLWLDNQIVLRETHARGNTNLLRSPSNSAIFANMQTVILANGSSASASEIVVGALIDHGVATFIGETTFGKGSVQSMVNLSAGGLLKVTTARWFTPENRNIEDDGIQPDIEIPLTIEDLNANRDPQLDAALNHLRR